MRGVMIALLSAILLAGCAASNDETRPAVSAQVSVQAPDGSRSLKDLGVENGPSDFFLPADAQFDVSVDQENNVTLMMSPAEGRKILDFLTENLPDYGYEIVDSSPAAVIFSGQWQGALSISGELAALTLRN